MTNQDEVREMEELFRLINEDIDKEENEAGEVGRLNLEEIIETRVKDFIDTLLAKKREEFVICAAVRASDGYVVYGHRHNFALRTLKEIPKYKDEHPHGDDQGFVTSKGRYVTRKEGYAIQIKAGIPSKLPLHDAYLGGELYSEDLY